MLHWVTIIGIPEQKTMFPLQSSPKQGISDEPGSCARVAAWLSLVGIFAALVAAVKLQKAQIEHLEFEPTDMKLPTQNHQRTSLELQIKYATLTHEYIKQLNKATDDRANYLIVGNSVIFASLSSVSRVDLPGYWIAALIATIAFVSLSIASSIIGLMPRIWELDIPIGTSGIERLGHRYKDHVRNVTEEVYLDSVCRENAVVSRIVQRKSMHITWACRLFLAALASGVAVLVAKALLTVPHH
jgi:hypothetical protein